MTQQAFVTHFGIHWDRNGIAHLMQGRGGANAVGAKFPSPFEVRLPGNLRHCNHQVALAAPVPNDYHWDIFLRLYGDQLVQAMLPLPKKDGGVYYIVADNPRLTLPLLLLSKLSSPIYPVVRPLRDVQPFLMNEMEITNIQPYVVTDCTGQDSAHISQVASVSANKPRTIIFCGVANVVLPSNVKRIETRLYDQEFNESELITLPWEAIGATVIRKYMRSEWPPQINPSTGLFELQAKAPSKHHLK